MVRNRIKAFLAKMDAAQRPRPRATFTKAELEAISADRSAPARHQEPCNAPWTLLLHDDEGWRA